MRLLRIDGTLLLSPARVVVPDVHPPPPPREHPPPPPRELPGPVGADLAEAGRLLRENDAALRRRQGRRPVS